MRRRKRRKRKTAENKEEEKEEEEKEDEEEVRGKVKRRRQSIGKASRLDCGALLRDMETRLLRALGWGVLSRDCRLCSAECYRSNSPFRGLSWGVFLRGCSELPE